MNNLSITILGCGLSGMISALSLAANDIKTTIIEYKSSKDKGFFSDPRTTAITDSSRQFFEKIDIWSDINKISGPINDIYVVDNKNPEMLHFASSELENQQIMGHLVQNSEFKKMLFERVSGNDLIEVKEQCNYSILENNEHKCILQLNEKTKHETDLLLVCDGRYSLAKEMFFSKQLEKDYIQSALTFLVHHQKPHEGTAVEHFIHTGPFAILPLKDQHISSIVWTVDRDMEHSLLKLPLDEFTEFVQDNFGEFLGKISVQGEIASFPLKAYEAKRYFNNRIALVADTAHIIHPLAGQGLNQGIKDIECLIDFILQFGINSHMLQRYQDVRKIDNRSMIEITDTLNYIFSNNSQILQAGRHLGFKAINKMPTFKKLLVKYAMGRRNQ